MKLISLTFANGEVLGKNFFKLVTKEPAMMNLVDVVELEDVLNKEKVSLRDGLGIVHKWGLIDDVMHESILVTNFDKNYISEYIDFLKKDEKN